MRRMKQSSVRVPILASWALAAFGAAGCGESVDAPSDVGAAGPPAAPAATEPARASAAEAVALPAEIVAERGMFVPEGVEFDTRGQRFLLGSVSEGAIFALASDGTLTKVASDPEMISSVGIEVDEATGRLLAAVSDVRIFTGGGPGQAKLGVFDLGSGEKIAMVDLAALLPDPSEGAVYFANDVAVGPDGVAYVTETRTGGLFRVGTDYQASLLHRFDPSATFAPNGIVYHPSGYLLVCGGTSLLKVPLDDPASAQAVELPEAIAGADGMLLRDDGTLALVANQQNRVLLLGSSDDWKTATIVDSAPYDVMATTVASVGDALYVVHPHFRDPGNPSVERVWPR